MFKIDRMNKLYIFSIIVLMTICKSVSAYDFHEGALYYSIFGNDRVEVVAPYGSSWTGYTQPTGSLIIPATVEHNGTSYRVKKIGVSAFSNCTGITSVTIPSTVEEIKSYAFYHCTGLQTVSFDNGINGPTAWYIGSDAFSGCTNLQNLNWEYVPISQIGSGAFANCSRLTYVSLCSGCHEIYEYTFANCNLRYLSIPSSVTSISPKAFCGNSNLQSITVASGNSHYDSRDNCNAIIATNSNKLVLGCKTTRIPNSVTSIGEYAFYCNNSLTSITIPDSVTLISSKAFSYCNFLDTIFMLSQVPPTNNYAFSSYPDTVYPNRHIYLPCGSYSSYISDSIWNSYSGYLSEYGMDNTLEVSSFNNTMGICEILTNTYTGIACDGMAVIQANPFYGYKFSHWNNGSLSAVDTLFVIGDSSLIAFFVPDTFSVSVFANDISYGTVTIQDSLVAYQSMAYVSAIPNQGYHFVQWDNGSTDNPYTFAVTSDTVLTAIFVSDNPEGIDNIETGEIRIWSHNGNIEVECDHYGVVKVFDLMGREMGHRNLPSGIYIVKVGSHIVQKILIVK